MADTTGSTPERPTYRIEPEPDFRIEPRHEWTEDGPGRLLGWDVLHPEWSVDEWGEANTGVVVFIEQDVASDEETRRWIVDALNAYAAEGMAL